VEYGPLETNPDILLPAIGLTNFLADMYNYTSIPQPGLGNQTAVLRGGAIVGGGSAVNSMFFDRGSAEDYDNWEKLGNPGWGWDGLLPYFQKVNFGVFYTLCNFHSDQTSLERYIHTAIRGTADEVQNHLQYECIWTERPYPFKLSTLSVANDT